MLGRCGNRYAGRKQADYSLGNRYQGKKLARHKHAGKKYTRDKLGKTGIEVHARKDLAQTCAQT